MFGRPDLYVTVIAWTPFLCSGAQAVLHQVPKKCLFLKSSGPGTFWVQIGMSYVTDVFMDPDPLFFLLEKNESCIKL
jgi:hypothetical protein